MPVRFPRLPRLPRIFARHHGPAWLLVLATLFWGMGFSWAKTAGEAIDRAAGLAADAPTGPVALLTFRFGTASMLWLICVPAARKDWCWRTVWRGTVIGLILALGLILQHVGLGVSDAAVIAFLTNLTVVFVPALMVIGTRRWPKAGVLFALPVALAGTALFAGVRASAPAAGAGWGVACAAAFAAEIIALDRLGRGESAARLTLVMFVVTALCCGLTAVCLPGATQLRLASPGLGGAVWADIALLIGLTTVAAFGIMTAFQPKVDPTRAAVLYLCEPLFAAAFAWWHTGRAMSGDALAGAVLILSANVIAEWRPRRVTWGAKGEGSRQ